MNKKQKFKDLYKFSNANKIDISTDFKTFSLLYDFIEKSFNKEKETQILENLLQEFKNFVEYKKSISLNNKEKYIIKDLTNKQIEKIFYLFTDNEENYNLECNIENFSNFLNPCFHHIEKFSINGNKYIITLFLYILRNENIIKNKGGLKYIIKVLQIFYYYDKNEELHLYKYSDYNNYKLKLKKEDIEIFSKDFNLCLI